MSLTSTIRERLQNLILGTYAPSATFSITTNRFRLHDWDAGTLEQNVDNTTDRAFQVDIGTATPDPQFNPLDGYILYSSQVKVRVSYLYTHGGDGLTENSTYDSGTGYLADILDRANTDMHDIIRTLTWHQNWGGLTPAVFAVVERSFTVTQLQTKIISEIGFTVRFQASTTTSYV